MTDQLIVPTADAVVTAVLEKLYEQRPTSFPHLNLRGGVYWHPVLGFRAQAATVLKRLAALVAAHRLDTAEGRELLDYIASEFEPIPAPDATKATGAITLTPGGLLLGGPIPKGSKFSRSATTSIGVSLPTCEFETITDAFVPAGSTAAVTIPVRALRDGADGNTPILVGASSTAGVTFSSKVADLSVTGFESGGGAPAANETYARLYARAFALGRHGPTSSASRLGALAGAGARHVVEYDVVETGTQKVLVADASWGSSTRWAKSIQQSMFDADLVGFGCNVEFESVRNNVVALEATVILRDYNYLSDTTDVELAIQKAVRAYFDDRVDWNVWNTGALKSVIARSHPKVFSCPTATLKSASNGATLSQILTPDYTAEQFHFYLASNATTLSFLGPS